MGNIFGRRVHGRRRRKFDPRDQLLDAIINNTKVEDMDQRLRDYILNSRDDAYWEKYGLARKIEMLRRELDRQGGSLVG